MKYRDGRDVYYVLDVMKICAVWDKYHMLFPQKLKIIRKGIFRVLLDQEAFFVAKYFSMKLTQHDKSHIKVGFPLSSQTNRLSQFEKQGLGYVMIDKEKNDHSAEYKVIKEYAGKYYNHFFQIDIQEYQLTKNRILGLYKIGLEEKQQKNFLLKDKIEEMYMIVSQRLIAMPKIERRYFREKIEKLFMEMLTEVYEFMYIPEERGKHISEIIKHCMIIREMTRFLYKMGKIKNDSAFLQTGEKRVEILKITKTIKQKYT